MYNKKITRLGRKLIKKKRINSSYSQFQSSFKFSTYTEIGLKTIKYFSSLSCCMAYLTYGFCGVYAYGVGRKSEDVHVFLRADFIGHVLNKILKKFYMNLYF